MMQQPSPIPRHHRCPGSKSLLVAFLSIGGVLIFLWYDVLNLRTDEAHQAINDSHGSRRWFDLGGVNATMEDQSVPLVRSDPPNRDEPVPEISQKGQNRASSSADTTPKVSTGKDKVVPIGSNSNSTPYIPDYPLRKAPTPKIGNRTIYFLHIHKSGGTTMCTMAKKNGMTANYRRNCNVQGDWHCCGNADTVEAQHKFATTTTFSFVSSESYMYKAMDPTGFYYAVQLRTSSDRYMSHYQRVARSAPVWKYEHPGTFETWWSHQPDNWSVRVICGPDCAHAPKYQISKDQWEETKRRLQAFDSIILLENFEETFGQFANKVGWSHGNDASKSHQNGASYEREPVVMDPFMTALDDALYEYAQQLISSGTGKLSSTTESAIERYFREGSLQGCNNRCCGNCSNSLVKPW
jgi:hypothetical protein